MPALYFLDKNCKPSADAFVWLTVKREMDIRDIVKVVAKLLDENMIDVFLAREPGELDFVVRLREENLLFAGKLETDAFWQLNKLPKGLRKIQFPTELVYGLDELYEK